MQRQESWAMKGGDGPRSYFRNSNLQKEAADGAKAMLVAAIVENVELEKISPSPNTFRIADFGCSVGPNTFLAVNAIMEAIEQKLVHTKGGADPNHGFEYQVFFNDRISNDFNTLFLNLPPNRPYFAAGVAGSFHGRLFPAASLSFAYSSFALHWLSVVPPALADPNSLSFNEGRIHYSNAPKEVGDAYGSQFATDMKAFLDARAVELLPGALMVVLMGGRVRGKPPRDSCLGPGFDVLESILVDMIHEGILGKDKLASFNLPLYLPTMEEVNEQIQKNGEFGIVKMEETTHEPKTFFRVEDWRAGMEGIFKSRFGAEIVDELFRRYAEKIAGLSRPSAAACGNGALLLVILKRK